MKTLTIAVVGKSSRAGQTHYIVPAKAAHGGPVPSLRLAFGKNNEVPVADEEHEAQLRADRNLKVLDEDGEHDKPEVDQLEVALAKLPPELKKQLEVGLRHAERAMHEHAEDLAKANAELRKELAKQDEQLSQAAKDKAELEAKLKAAIAALPAPSDTKPPDVKPEKPAKK